ncbi:MAG: TetR/AcrR family transcriptional regulator [Clostridium sp.]|nr:TetR/AcrR family transcriptional regulator [Clostridium sp.]
MRKKDDTLRDTLLDCARSVADSEGLRAVNIRSIARKAGIATGTVYNYFANKDEILLALTEDYWKQALVELGDAVTSDSFCGQLEEIFLFLRDRIDRSAGRLMGSLVNVEAAGLHRMESMQTALESSLVRRMEQDGGSRGDIWDETFTRKKFARFLMMNMTMLLRVRAQNMDFLMEIVKRTIY